DLALVHAPIGQLEALARAPLLLRPDEQLRQLRIAAVELHELLVLDVRGRLERRPPPRAIVVVGAAPLEPRLHRVRRARRPAPRAPRRPRTPSRPCPRSP